MTSISGLQSCGSSSAVYTKPVAGSGSKSNGIQSKFESQLDSALTSQGLNSDERSAVESDLKSAMDSLFESGSAPPDPDQVKSTVSDVFAKYGLDADKLASRLGPGGGPPPGGPPPGGPPPGGSSASSGTSGYEDSTTSLMDSLKALLEQLGTDQSADSDQATQYLMTALIGFDAEA